MGFLQFAVVALRGGQTHALHRIGVFRAWLIVIRLILCRQFLIGLILGRMVACGRINAIQLCPYHLPMGAAVLPVSAVTFGPDIIVDLDGFNARRKPLQIGPCDAKLEFDACFAIVGLDRVVNVGLVCLALLVGQEREPLGQQTFANAVSFVPDMSADLVGFFARRKSSQIGLCRPSLKVTLASQACSSVTKSTAF